MSFCFWSFWNTGNYSWHRGGSRIVLRWGCTPKKLLIISDGSFAEYYLLKKASGHLEGGRGSLGSPAPLSKIHPCDILHSTWLEAWIIVNRCRWLWNSTYFVVLCFCLLFWPWLCTNHTPFLKDSQSLALINLFKTQLWTENKRLCVVSVKLT